MKEYAESERLEQLTAEKRRLKILEYRQTVNDMLEERRQRRTEELQYLMGLHDLEVEEEKARYQAMLYLYESKMTSFFFPSSFFFFLFFFLSFQKHKCKAEFIH